MGGSFETPEPSQDVERNTWTKRTKRQAAQAAQALPGLRSISISVLQFGARLCFTTPVAWTVAVQPAVMAWLARTLWRKFGKRVWAPSENFTKTIGPCVAPGLDYEGLILNWISTGFAIGDTKNSCYMLLLSWKMVRVAFSLSLSISLFLEEGPADSRGWTPPPFETVGALGSRSC